MAGASDGECAPSECSKRKKADSARSDAFSLAEKKNFLNGEPLSANYRKLLKQRQALPVFARREEIVAAGAKHKALVLVSDAGSGKTTQCPQFFLRAGLAGDKAIAVTQPRRVAATSVALRVAEEMDVALGAEVGYSIRFDHAASARTKLLFLTDGVLLREAQADPLLSKYGAVFIDEAHERTVNTDILLGQLKLLARKRADLKIVIMSATLDCEKFVRYFDAARIRIAGRNFPVELRYLSAPCRNYYESALDAAVQIHLNEPPGDVLVFLTGEREICDMRDDLLVRLSAVDEVEHGPVRVDVIFSALTHAEQMRIFQPAPAPVAPNGRTGRKIVLSTNISETSLTIDGIVYVIDTGYAKQKVYHPRTRASSLAAVEISKSNAAQRAGRAGRTQPGKCFRLYTESSFENMADSVVPEILRSPVDQLVIQLLALDIPNLIRFPFLDPPSPEAFMRAFEQLHLQQVIDDECKLTPFGRRVAQLPLDPTLAVMLERSAELGVQREVRALVALLSVNSVFAGDATKRAPPALKSFVHPSSEHRTLVNLFYGFLDAPEPARFCRQLGLNHTNLAMAARIQQQLLALADAQADTQQADTDADANEVEADAVADAVADARAAARAPQPTHANFLRCILHSLFYNVAVSRDGKSYSPLGGGARAALHPGALLSAQPKLVVYNELLRTNQLFLRTVSEIAAEDLRAACPAFYEKARGELHLPA